MDTQVKKKRAAQLNAEKFERTLNPENYYNKARSRFKEYYGTNFARFSRVKEFAKLLISHLFDESDFSEPKITTRIKDRESALEKFDREYRNSLERDAAEYEIKDHIDDIVGVRIACWYEDNIPEVVEKLRTAFDVKAIKDKTTELEEDHSRFGYKGIHLDVCFHQSRLQFPEYRGIEKFQFEIQVRTIVQNAWSEVDHKLKYKKEIPDVLKRRVVRMAALFELADQEFQLIRDETQKLEELTASDEIACPKKEEPKIDAFSLSRIFKTHFQDFIAQPYYVDQLAAQIRQADPAFTVSETKTAISTKLGLVNQYVRYLGEIGHKMAPFNKVRHCLYAYDNDKFQQMLFPGRIRNFDRWQKTGSVFPVTDKKPKAS